VAQSTELQVRLATVSDESDVLEAITSLLRELSGELSGTAAFYERSGFSISGVRARRIRQHGTSG